MARHRQRGRGGREGRYRRVDVECGGCEAAAALDDPHVEQVIGLPGADRRACLADRPLALRDTPLREGVQHCPGEIDHLLPTGRPGLDRVNGQSERRGVSRPGGQEEGRESGR